MTDVAFAGCATVEQPRNYRTRALVVSLRSIVEYERVLVYARPSSLTAGTRGVLKRCLVVIQG